MASVEHLTRSSRAGQKMILVLGLNHTTAPIEIRERLSFSNSGVQAACQQILSASGLSECAILSTCNRTEIYGVAPADVTGPMLQALAEGQGVQPSLLSSHSYQYAGADAVQQLCRVAAGLDSMVLGEGQVLRQVKDAAEAAVSAGTSGPLLAALFRQAVVAGKRARTETGIAAGAVSISHAAVELSRQIFGELAGCRALVLGAGEMSEITLKLLKNAGMRTSIMISSRTRERAENLAQKCGGIGIEWEDFPAALCDADIVIVSTSAPHPIVRCDTVRQAMRARRGRHIFLIDISVPRNVEPEAGDISDVFLYNIDDLQGVVDRNLGDRSREIEGVEAIISQEVERFKQWQNGLDVVPAIVGLREHAENARIVELENFSDRLAHLPERDRKTVEILTRQLTRRVIQEPVERLKKLGVNGRGYDRVEVVRELFGLGEADTFEGQEEDGVGSLGPSEQRESEGTVAG